MSTVELQPEKLNTEELHPFAGSKELYVIRCSAENKQHSFHAMCLAGLRDQLSQSLWAHFAQLNAPLATTVGLWLIPGNDPLPLGRYVRGQNLCWQDVLIPRDAIIRSISPGPLAVIGATEYVDRYQTAFLETEGEPDETDGGFICAVYHDRVRQQQELVLLDSRTQHILVAPPGLFRYDRTARQA